MIGQKIVVVTGPKPIGVIYGAVELIELIIQRNSRLFLVDTDFEIRLQPDLFLFPFEIKSQPFYPIRATLEIESPNWMARHRINMSGAEGVWSGTGNDDGIGTAFQYVDRIDFELYQDLSQIERELKISQLNRRFRDLKRRGIEPYLFMYLTGEPTNALIRNRPDLLGETVIYAASRNGAFYRPFCWSNPETIQLFRDLAAEIVRTYPDLAGFHLRAWGKETRACECEKCGGHDDRGQKLLWQILFEIIESARSVRPNFKFYVTGYDAHWLKDPHGNYARQLPKGTIFSKKWGSDGEPTNDPNISEKLLDRLAEIGHELIILSHDVEEVMPFWMVEGDLFAEGVRKFSVDDRRKGLGGFTVQGAKIGFGKLDRMISAKINWDVNLDHRRLMRNYLVNRYGHLSATEAIEAITINTALLSDYFHDYAGTLRFNGSASLATRFWDIIGVDAVADQLSRLDPETSKTAIEKLSILLSRSLKSSNLINSAITHAKSPSPISERELKNESALYQIWVDFFESRLSLAEAVKIGYDKTALDQLQVKIDRAIEYDRRMISEIKTITEFVPIFGYSRGTIVASLIEKLDAEIAWLSSYDVKNLARPIDVPLPDRLEISQVLNVPNPFDRSTTFTYVLNRLADNVSISIYNSIGRKVQTLTDLSARRGYNETVWDGRDQNGDPLSNGVYFYRLTVLSEGQRQDQMGRIAILR